MNVQVTGQTHWTTKNVNVLVGALHFLVQCCWLVGFFGRFRDIYCVPFHFVAAVGGSVVVVHLCL